MKENWPGKWLSGRLKECQPVLLVLAVGLALMLWPRSGGTGEEPVQAGRGSETAFQTEALEARLEEALGQIQGVGQVSVVLTLERGTRQVLATDRNGEEEETVVVSSGSGQQEAVTVQEIGPEFQGALVVCTGGGDAQVRLQVLQAVKALTGLGANQISICEGTGGREP